MNPEPNQRQLDALEKYLRGELDANHPDLPAEEATLARQLRAAGSRMQPTPQFAASLNKQLAQAGVPAPARRVDFRYLFSSLAGIAALVLLAFLLRWLILSVAPQPPIPALPSTRTPLAQVTATPPAPDATEAVHYYAPLFSGTFSLGAVFPANQAQANLYEQLTPAPASLEFSRSLAEKFGLSGTLYLITHPGEGGDPIYMATDGKQRLHIYNSTQYDYYPDWARMSETVGLAEDAQFAIQHAEAYLQAHGLLDFPYRAETTPGHPSLVSFVPTLDGLPLRFASGHTSPRLEIQISAQGDVVYLSAYLPASRLVGSYPLRTAENAWERMIGVSTDLGLVGDFSTSSPTNATHIWLRNYPMGQPLRLSGQLENLPSADGGEPFFSLNSYPIRGNLDGLDQLPPNSLLTAKGQFVQVDNVTTFDIESWEKLSAEKFLAGTLESAGEKVFLLSEDGRRLELPDLPVEVFPAANGKEFHARGLLDGESLDWSTVYVGPLGGGGGGGGGITSLAQLNLSGTPAPTRVPPVIPTPLVADAIAGKPVEAASGSVDIMIFESRDGQRHMQVTFNPDEPVNEIWNYRLAEGPGLAGIEKYNRQPVRIWGKVSGLDPYNIPLITVERYEPLYPGLKSQIWIGKEEVAIIQGKKVLLFTTEDGQAYVLSESFLARFDPANVQPLSDRFVGQGMLLPGEEWGGYPVVELNQRMFGGVGEINLDDLPKEFSSNEPRVVPAEAVPPVTPQGATIEKIELVYLAKDLRGLSGSDLPAQVYIQPAWSFSGHYADGTAFEIYVQALTDDRLSSEPDF